MSVPLPIYVPTRPHGLGSAVTPADTCARSALSRLAHRLSMTLKENDSATQDRRADDRPVTDAARAAQKLEFRVTVRTVPRLGTPVLRLVASELDMEHTDRSWLRSLVEDLVDTLRDQNGVGIAAPQVGVSLRIFVIEVRPDNPRYENAGDVPLRIAINPRLELLGARDKPSFEGCLSVPDMRGVTLRHESVILGYLDERLIDQQVQLNGFEAIIAQHETDHLNGKLYVDRLRSSRDFGFLPEVTDFNSVHV
jgi:peptide deformylase